jgi:hypothetical protein
MRLWTVHPKYLDAKGIVALWREGLLAKAVLAGETKGYIHHPQLIRFRAHPQPLAAVCEYLRSVLTESQHRGYCFDEAKLPSDPVDIEPIEESQGQLAYEWQHLLNKLSVRDPDRFQQWSTVKQPEPHPLFTMVPGKIKDWEKGPKERTPTYV